MNRSIRVVGIGLLCLAGVAAAAPPRRVVGIQRLQFSIPDGWGLLDDVNAARLLGPAFDTTKILVRDGTTSATENAPSIYVHLEPNDDGGGLATATMKICRTMSNDLAKERDDRCGKPGCGGKVELLRITSVGGLRGCEEQDADAIMTSHAFTVSDGKLSVRILCNRVTKGDAGVDKACASVVATLHLAKESPPVAGAIKSTQDYKTKQMELEHQMDRAFAQNDCNKAAADVTAFLDRYQPTLDALVAWEKTHADDQEALKRETGAEQLEILTRVSARAELCKDNPAFKAAMAKMQ
jgi:hypothetical protein